jgi:hypothetical protein
MEQVAAGCAFSGILSSGTLPGQPLGETHSLRIVGYYLRLTAMNLSTSQGRPHRRLTSLAPLVRAAVDVRTSVYPPTLTQALMHGSADERSAVPRLSIRCGVCIRMWRDFAQGIPVACWAGLTDAAFKPMPRVQGRVTPMAHPMA